MEILLIAATKDEISPILKSGLVTDTLITGVGTPNTLYYLQKKLSKKKYDLVIQAGIAGSFTNVFSLGDVVIVSEDCFADIGIEEYGGFIPIFETPMANENDFPYKNGWLVNDRLLPSDTLPSKKILLPVVRAITINKVSDSKKQKITLLRNFEAQIETMEGAALHFVCLQENIPFLQMRSISNYVSERDKTKWELELAIQNLNKELKLYLKKALES